MRVGIYQLRGLQAYFLCVFFIVYICTARLTLLETKRLFVYNGSFYRSLFYATFNDYLCHLDNEFFSLFHLVHELETRSWRL